MALNDPHTVFHDLLAGYLSGELTDGERKKFLEAAGSDPVLQKELDTHRKVWDSMDGLAARRKYDLDTEWEQMKGRIPAFGNTAEDGVAGKSDRKGSFLFYAYRIAAVLVVGLIFAFAWLYSTRMGGTVQVVAENESVEVVLKDGSRVVLNRNSTLVYPRNMDRRGRKVVLTGEAWFQVTRDSLRPFTIDAGPAVVEVLGTRFNVNAYRENPKVEITVESGIVSLSPKEDHHEQIILKAGNSGTYDNRNRELVLNKKSDPNNLSWKTRDLYFENTPLGDVAELLARVYAVEVKFGNQAIRDCPITVTFRNQSLESVLSVLELTLDLEITRSGNVLVLDGEGCAE